MKNSRATHLALALSLAGLCQAVTRDDLSEAARALVPKDVEVTVTLKDGTELRGLKSRETETELHVKVRQKGGSIYSTKMLSKADLRAVIETDIGEILATQLLELTLDPKTNLAVEVYQQSLALLYEFHDKFATAKEAKEVEERRAAFADEYAKLQQGRLKVDGVWLAPIRSQISLFDSATDKLKTLESTTEWRT